MMVQKRQFRKSHIDEHYCAAIFRYLREYALKLQDECLFICLDDKHRLKVGEPGFPVAAAERGRRVIVSLNEEFQVGDHDFTRFSIIPSVIFHIDIPDSIEGSWYDGQVCVTLKEAAFQPSSALRQLNHRCGLLQGLGINLLCFYIQMVAQIIVSLLFRHSFLLLLYSSI